MPESLPQPNLFLRQAREAREWTQRQLADLLNVSIDAVRSWESGRRTPSPAQRIKLSEIFVLPPEQLGLQPVPQDSTEAFPLQEEPAPVFAGPRGQTDARATITAPVESKPHQAGFLLHRAGNEERRKMLLRVRSTWIEGVLQRSLHHAALIALDFLDLPEALANPWHLAVQETRGPALPLPAGTSIVQVYDGAQGHLLLLGEPGAGKTTLLLELARTLLSRAEQDEQVPMPVVFHLSSWTGKHLDLAPWLVEELQRKYRIPPNVAQEWVKTDRLALLLDGLDEVAETARPRCVQAINAYQQAHALVPLVVSCRRKEYVEQTTRVQLQQAILVQPLTREQVDAYLSSAGEQLTSVKQALREDPELESMMRTPLMLSIVALAYQGRHMEVMMTGTKEERLKHIFDAYIQRMLTRRGQTSSSPQQTIQWLSWLASQMKARGQTVFYVERMQPDWLPDALSTRRYRLLVERLIFASCSLVYPGLLAFFRSDLIPDSPGLFSWLGGGPKDRVLGWMAPGIGGWISGATSIELMFALVVILVNLLGDKRTIPTFHLKAVKQAMLVGATWSLVLGSALYLLAGFALNQQGGWICLGGASCGSSIGLFGGVLVGVEIGVLELFRYDLRQKKPSFFALKDLLFNGILYGLCSFVGLLGVYAILAGGINRSALGYSAVVGLYFGVVFSRGSELGILHELGVAIQPAESIVWSWQAVRQTFLGNLRKGVGVAMVLFFCAVGVTTAISSLFHDLTYGIRYGLVYGALVGTITGIITLLMGILISGWSSDMLDERDFARPNEGIRRLMRNALVLAGIFGPLGGILSGLVCAVVFAAGGISGWLILGAGLAFLFTVSYLYQIGMLYGLIAVIEHYVLRWALSRERHLSWNGIAFFDEAAERILLQKVGGGYMFIHRFLLEHFANKYENAKGVKR